MKTFSIFATILLALVACEDRRPTTWSGVPDGPASERVCSWVGPSGDHVGTCIIAGRAYSCVWDKISYRVACALTSPVVPIEVPAIVPKVPPSAITYEPEIVDVAPASEGPL